MDRRIACTIISANYFAYAKTLAQSFRAKNPEGDFFALIVDRKSRVVDAAANTEGITLFYVEDLQIPDFQSVSFKYDILELNTNVKPTFLKKLFSLGFEKVIYFDPDIYIYDSVGLVYDLLDSNNIVATPHAIRPTPDLDRPSDLDFAATGTFNLGFIAVRKTDETARFLDWWEERCLGLAYAETRTGLFVDQKWIDLAPCFFDGFHFLKHKGCNAAHWNCHERNLKESAGKWTMSGTPLLFFHFSGIDILEKNQISKHQKTVRCGDMAVLVKLFETYRNDVLNNGYTEYIRIPYGFGEFSNGRPINSITRRVYSIYANELVGADPFDASGAFYKLANKANLLKGRDWAGKVNVLNYNKTDWQLKCINTFLHWLLKTMGGGRYTALMKYLSYVSILRHQREILAWKIEHTTRS